MSIVVMEPTSTNIESSAAENYRAETRPVAPLRIGFWGTRSAFANTVLTALLKTHSLTHVAFPAAMPGAAPVTRLPSPFAPPRPDDLLLVNNAVMPDPLQTAWQYNLDAYQISHLRAPGVAEWLHSLALDVICVACFPWRIPAPLLTVPTYGFLNVHPALLPDYRGPAPLFWQLRAGLSKIGVTVHWMDADFDTGALAAQHTLTLPDGVTVAVADQLCAQTGAELLGDVLQQLARGLVPRQLQPSSGSYQSWPTAADFRLCAAWSAQHAYNFMQGTAEWHQPYPLTLGDAEILLHSALFYDEAEILAAPFVRDGATLLIQFQPGVLHAVPWPV